MVEVVAGSTFIIGKLVAEPALAATLLVPNVVEIDGVAGHAGSRPTFLPPVFADAAPIAVGIGVAIATAGRYPQFPFRLRLFYASLEFLSLRKI